jgi:hypothetical protein
MDLKRLKILLTKYGDSILKEMITRLTSNAVRGTSFNSPGVASGALKNSLHYNIKENLNSLELSFSMLDYGVYVDKGRKPGKQPPLKGIKEWCKIKGIPETAAFPIARNIGRFGIPATNFYSIPLARNEQRLKDDIKKLIQEELKKDINNNLK